MAVSTRLAIDRDEIPYDFKGIRRLFVSRRGLRVVVERSLGIEGPWRSASRH